METKTVETLYLYGASGHGKVVAEIAEDLGFESICFVDDNQDLKNIWDYYVIQQLPENPVSIVLSLGNNLTRKKLSEIHPNLSYQTLVSPKSHLSKRAKIGYGTVVMSGVTINTEVIIGNHVILNTNSSIDHECVIGDFVHISPNASLAGNVEIGEGTHIGIGSTVIQGIKIGKWAMIGAGAVVISDVPDYAVVVGNPGKIIKFQKE